MDKPQEPMMNLAMSQIMTGANFWDAPGHSMGGSNDLATRTKIFAWIKAHEKTFYLPRTAVDPIGVYFSPDTTRFSRCPAPQPGTWRAPKRNAFRDCAAGPGQRVRTANKPCSGQRRNSAQADCGSASESAVRPAMSTDDPASQERVCAARFAQERITRNPAKKEATLCMSMSDS